MKARATTLSVAVVVAALAASPLLGQTRSGADAEAIVQRSDAALAALRTLRTEFTQRVENPVLERVSTGAGTLVYEDSGRLRIAYSEPAGDLIVNDGRHVWIYLPSSQPGQVIRQLSGDSGVRNPLTFLRDLRGLYDVRGVEPETIAGRSTDRLELSPVDPAAPYDSLVVWVDRSSALPVRVRTRTEQDVVTTYTFLGFTVDGRVSAAEFDFDVPRHVEVFDQ